MDENKLKALKKKYDIKTIHNFNVRKLKKKSNGYIVSDGKQSIYTDQIIISTGGQAAPVLGSTGDAFLFLEEFFIKSTKGVNFSLYILANLLLIFSASFSFVADKNFVFSMIVVAVFLNKGR